MSPEPVSHGGPLVGVRVIEIAGIGPGPYAAMMLADMGADVIRVERADPPARPDRVARDVLNRGRRSVGVDLKKPEDVALLLDLVAVADGLIEPFRPGVAERLGVGPAACLERNPRLVYGRMTGWGQSGPYSQVAGHDINYLALSGALHCVGRAGERPVPPVNFVGDFGGGGMFLAFGMACALFEASRSGCGQVVDAAIVDGAASLTTMLHAFRAMSVWKDDRGVNIVDSGAHFYDVYETSDHRYVAVGAIEAKFYEKLLSLAGLAGRDLPPQNDKSRWPEMKDLMVEVFATRTRDEWCELMEGTDACFAPVLSLDEAPTHAHNVERETFVEIDGITQPAPAPRFSRTPGSVSRPPALPGQHTNEVLSEWLGR